MPANIYTSNPFDIQPLDHEFWRADIIFHEVDHSGVSYEAAVFVNNLNANENTERTLAQGYAGKFHIFGHGGCLGDVGHCTITGKPRPFDPRPGHPLTPAKKIVIATQAVKQAVDQGKDATITVVPTITSPSPDPDDDTVEHNNVLKFEQFSILTYR